MYFEYGENELNHLRKRDKKLACTIDQIGMLQREVNPDVFAALIESIVGQQISVKAANTVRSRLIDACRGHLNPNGLIALGIEGIAGCGMNGRKAGYILGASEAAMDGRIDFDTLIHKTDAEIIQLLTALNGVGLWTVEMLLIFSLMRPNVCSYGDLAIRRGMMRLYGIASEKDLTREKFVQYTKRYTPYGSVASFYIWEMA